VGEPPDLRTQAAARRRGYDLSGLRARKVAREDFHRFDLLLAMDRAHQDILGRLAPPSAGHKVRLMMGFARGAAHDEVPDPYYGGPEGFELVLDLLEDAAAGLLERLRLELDPR
jgi:protein-tyrosine phosphatase